MPPILLLAALALLTAAALAQSQVPFKDPRDGKSYRAVKIGEQVWMAENLNYNAEGSKCPGYKEENCKKYGRLYNWEMAMKACPNGWHLPDSSEWEILVDFAGGKKVAGKKLKAKSGWINYEDKADNGTDNYGFTALPSGYNVILDIGSTSFWWSSSDVDDEHAYYINFDKYAYLSIWFLKPILFSVRCLKD